MITATVTVILWVKCRRVFYRRCRSRYFRDIFIILVILSLVMILYLCYHLKVGVRRPGTYIIDRGGCFIGDFEPWNLEVVRFLKISEPPNCTIGLPPLVKINLTKLYIDMDAIPYYVKSNGDFYCCYRSFYLHPPTYPGRRGRKNFSYDCIQFVEVSIKDDYVEVQCFVQNVKVFNEHFALIQMNPKVEERCENVTSKKKSSDFNVLMLGIEGMSRNHLLRVMPRTVELLHNMSAVDMAGMNVVGLHAGDNIMPILTGLKSSEEESLWPEPEKLKPYPWIFKNFNKAGFRTAYGDNCDNKGIFKQKKSSFHNTHLDYFFQAKFCMHLDGQVSVYPQEKYCIGSRTYSQILIDYMDDFVTQMITKRFFGIFWDARLTSYDFNIHSAYDSFYVKFLQKHIQSGLFNTTVLIFSSDRGYYGSGVKDTFQGLQERHNPFLFVVLPEKFKKKYFLATKNLYKNTQKLITAFDIHETLKDILYHEKMLQVDAYVNRTQEMKEQNSFPRGMSLFLPVPENRHCTSIDISAKICLCLNVASAETTNELLEHVTYPVLHELLKLVSKYPQCSILKLDKVYIAQVNKQDTSIFQYFLKSFSGNVKDKKLKTVHHKIIIKTKPGNALFEVSYSYPRPQNISRLHSINRIKRINRYGNESKCIDDVSLKPFCYCKESGISNK